MLGLKDNAYGVEEDTAMSAENDTLKSSSKGCVHLLVTSPVLVMMIQ